MARGSQGVGHSQSRRGTTLPRKSLDYGLEGSGNRWGQRDGRIEGIKALGIYVKGKASYGWFGQSRTRVSRGGAAPGGDNPQVWAQVTEVAERESPPKGRRSGTEDVGMEGRSHGVRRSQGKALAQ